MLNPVNWIFWIALCALYSMGTYNPVYLGGLLVALSALALSKKHPLMSYLRLGAAVSLIPLAANILLVKSGEQILFELPSKIDLLVFSLPTFFLGGPLTFESIVMASVMFLLMCDLLLAFQIFNRELTPDEMISVMPGFFTSIVMTVIIALRFVPQVLSDFNSIRDAQISRGFKLTSGGKLDNIRAKAGLVLPTLITSVERSFSLAESMASRAYTGKRTRYKGVTWSSEDLIYLALFTSSIVLTIYLNLSGALQYWPYEQLTVPYIEPLAVIPLLVVASPMLKWKKQ